jgi:hypothetical protein
MRIDEIAALSDTKNKYPKKCPGTPLKSALVSRGVSMADFARCPENPPNRLNPIGTIACGK